MAAFEKRGQYWRVKIRRKGYPEQTQSFDLKSKAEAWATDHQSEVLSLGVPKQLAGLATEEAWRDCLAKWRRVYFDELAGFGVSADDLMLVAGGIDARASGDVRVSVARLLVDMDGTRR